MFYIYNDISVLKNKKNSNAYKEALKVLVADIKNTDFDILINTNVYIKSDICSDIDKLILKIYSSQNINYKLIEKELNKLYKKYGLINMLSLYVASTNQILDTYLFNRVVAESKRVYLFENIENFFSSCALLAKISLFAIIFNNDLLNYKIDYIAKTNNNYKIIKNLRKEDISLAKGLYDMPVLISTSELRRFKNSLDEDILSPGDIKDYMQVYNILLFQSLCELLYFKEEYKNYFNFKYEYDTNVLYKKNIFSIDHNVIKLRKVLPPKGGVILKVNGDDDIESIFIDEKEDLNSRAIAGVVRYLDGTEEDFIFLLNNNVSSSIYCRCSEKVFMALLLFYEVDYDTFEKTLNKYGRLDFEVLAPYYWKYRKANYETNTEKQQRLQGKKVKREYTVNISTFIRRIKGSASKEAQDLANKLCVKLEPGYTIVREHKRTYNKSKDESIGIEKMAELLKNLSSLA